MTPVLVRSVRMRMRTDAVEGGGGYWGQLRPPCATCSQHTFISPYQELVHQCPKDSNGNSIPNLCGCKMSKRKYEVPEHFKELVRSALQKPKVAVLHDEPSCIPADLPLRQSNCGGTSVSSSSSLSDVSPTKPLHVLPMIPASSFYSTKERVRSPPRGAAVAAITVSPNHGAAVRQFAPAEPAYLRLIQLYKQRSNLFGAERRQHCFQMFAKLKEALEFANNQTNCRVFAQEGRKYMLTCIIYGERFIFPLLNSVQ